MPWKQGFKKKEKKKRAALSEKEACLFTLFAWIPIFDWFPVNVDCGQSASNLALQFSISQILERSINLFIWYLQKEPVTSSVLLREAWEWASSSYNTYLLAQITWHWRNKQWGRAILPASSSKTAVVVDGSTGLALDTLEDRISPDPNVHCLGHCQARQLIVLRDMSEWEPGCMWLCFT